MSDSALQATLPVPATAEATERPTANRWWQWVLLYPALAVALVSAVPTWIDHVQAMRIGVDRRNLAQAQEQNKLWQVNLECARVQEIQRIKTARNMEIGAQVCPSGDVLLLLKRPEAEQPTFRWVSARTLEQEARVSLVTPAYADEREVPRTTTIAQSVVNQRWLRPGVLKQRVRGANGCADLVINTYTGSVTSRMPVSCGAPF
jgi:hypothetical protein